MKEEESRARGKGRRAERELSEPWGPERKSLSNRAFFFILRQLLWLCIEISLGRDGGGAGRLKVGKPQPRSQVSWKGSELRRLLGTWVPHKVSPDWMWKVQEKQESRTITLQT